MPLGFEVKGKEDHVCLLNKSLSGFKQSPRQCYKRFDEFANSNDYFKSNYDSCVYFCGSNLGRAVYLLLYINDMLIARKIKVESEKLKRLLSGEFEMNDLGCAKKIFRVDIIKNKSKNTLFVSQKRYIKKVLDKFDMLDTKHVLTFLGPQFKLSKLQAPSTRQYKFLVDKVLYAQEVGSLIYAIICTRVDISNVISVINRFMSDHGKEH